MTMINSNNNNMNNNNNNNVENIDTRMTKVFVGGLAWETPKEAMKEHFDKYGEIVEAVVISENLTGRSKGYGFVTFKDAEAAKKACEDPNPIINGRRANCNLAALGARRTRSSDTTTTIPSPQKGVNVGPRAATSIAHANHVQWYYPQAVPAAPFHHQHQHQHQHQAVPLYGYAPTYIATSGMNYNHKLGFTGGPYINGTYSQVYPGQAVMGANTMMPMYPLYHYQQSPTMGLPAHMFSPITSGPVHTVPAMISKPTSFTAPKAVA